MPSNKDIYILITGVKLGGGGSDRGTKTAKFWPGASKGWRLEIGGSCSLYF